MGDQKEPLNLYTRWKHGGDPVTVYLDASDRATRFDRLMPSGVVQSYHTFKALQCDLYGKDVRITWRTYFYVDAKGVGKVPLAADWDELLTESRTKQILETALEQSGLTVDTPLGIDLQARGHEVAKLLYAGFGKKIYSAGYDPDDVLQEVYKGILARNNGKCPWDPAKSSFGHYVHMVCGCVLANYHRQAGRRGAKEQVGMRHYNDGKWETVDVASADVALESDGVAAPDARVEQHGAMDALAEFILSHERGTSREAEIAVQLIPLKARGYTRTEIADLISVSPSMVSRGLSFLRERAREWSSTL